MKIKGLVPMLATEDLAKTIKFYRENLDFECRGVYPDEENPCWASLWNGEVEIAFSTPDNHTNFEKPALTGSLYFHVESIEDFWRKLKDKVEIIYPPQDFDYGMREFGIRDCNGYILNLGQNIG